MVATLKHTASAPDFGTKALVTAATIASSAFFRESGAFA